MPNPAASPRTDASRPITTASTSTEPIICRRLAPIARMSASSRVRCATMIENVLRIRKMPTNSATAAKPSRTLLKKSNPCLMSDAVASCSSLAVAQRGAQVGAQRVRGDPGRRGHVDRGVDALLAEHQLLRDREGEQHDLGAAEGVAVAGVPEDADEGERLTRLQGQHADLVTDLDAGRLGQGRVDRDLVVGARPAPLPHLDQVVVAGPVAAEAGRAERADHLAVAA